MFRRRRWLLALMGVIGVAAALAIANALIDDSDDTTASPDTRATPTSPLAPTPAPTPTSPALPSPTPIPTPVPTPNLDDAPRAASVDLGEVIRSHADGGIVVLPAGTYIATDVTGVTPSTPLVLLAEEPGAVVVRTSPFGDNQIWTVAESSNIVFVGLSFRDLTLLLERSREVSFWHTHHTYPITAFGDPTVKRCDRLSPIAVYLDHTTGVAFHGADIVDAGDDGLRLDNADDTLVVGTHIADIWDRDLQTRTTGCTDPTDLTYHNDSIQIFPGGVDGLTVLDSTIEQVLMLQVDDFADPTSNSRIVLRDSWLVAPLVDFCVTVNTRVKPGAPPDANMDLTLDSVTSWCRDDAPDWHLFTGGGRPGALTINGEVIDPEASHSDAGYLDIRQGTPTGPAPHELWRQLHPFEGWACLLDGSARMTSRCQ